MGKKRNNIILSLFFVSVVLNSALAFDNNILEPLKELEIQNAQRVETNQNYFNLANIVDSFLTNDFKQNKVAFDDKTNLRKDFISITSKFNQGNAKVAYDEYNSMIDKVENDTSLLNLSKIFYEIGYFSLANKATEKIVYKNQFYDNILDLELSYKPKANLNVEQEIYFAKLYSDIYFNNNIQEAINELLDKKNQYLKNDFYNYVLAKAYFENSQLNQALQSINKAISQNQENVSYQILKTDILISLKKYNDAKATLEKISKKKTLINFLSKIEMQNEAILSQVSTNNQDKRFYSLNKMFLEGNFEKVKKETQNLLNFDKDNDKLTSLYAKSELALGNIERANAYFVNSYKLEKNNINTLVGLGDIRYLHGDYKNAVKIYKKAYKKEKNNPEILIKLTTAQRQHAQNPKELKKLELKVEKMGKDAYLGYYKSAISLAQKNSVLKEEFLKRSLNINPLYENALGELIEVYLKNKNYQLAKNLIYNVSFTLEKNYYYYYLCGLYNQAINKKQEAMQFYKTSLNLNPNFEIANTRLLKLIPDVINEEI